MLLKGAGVVRYCAAQGERVVRYCAAQGGRGG